MDKGSSIPPILFGAIVVNTMPVWLGAVANHPGVSDAGAGAIGSLVLGTAAVFCSGVGTGFGVRIATCFISGCLVLLALGDMLPLAALVLSSIGLGASLGRVTGHALLRATGTQGLLRTISVALSLGLAVSMLVYLVLPILDVSLFWILAVLSTALIARPAGQTSADQQKVALLRKGLPFRYLPFFVMMGAYWTFLELFGRDLNGADVLPIWLLGSLVAGALGSLLAGAVPVGLHSKVSTMTLLAAAVSGALSYVSGSMIVLGLSILANGFFLFLFFPLYLSLHPHGAPKAMAAYLLGFAAGGLAGALLVEIGGYTTLAAVILLSGLPTILQRRTAGAS